MARIYHILPGPDGYWLAREENATNAVLRSDNWDEIVEDMMGLGRVLGDTRLMIHGTDGSLLEERSCASIV